jgi:glucose-1-phosphate thymidylyltransferase
MKAVILAAGEGRRLEPLTDVRPKPMLPIANRPLLEHVVDAVVEAGIEEIVLVVGYERERIQDHFGDGGDWGVRIQYAIQERQLGTGHAVLQAEPYVEGEFLALNGDRIVEPDVVRRLAEADRDDVLMAVTHSDEPSDYGVVEMDGERVTRIREKPPAHSVVSDFINAGIYAFDPGVFDEIRQTRSDGEQAVTDTLERYIGDDRVRAVPFRGQWLDVSHLWDLLSVNAGVLDRQGSTVGDDARVHDRATVSGTVAIGADTRVRPGATVLRGTSLGANVDVGANAVLSNVVVLPDATIEPGCVLRDCVVGENAHVGPNATVEGGRADLVVDDTFHEDVRFGGALGDNAVLGGAVTLEPGAIVGTGARVESGSVVADRVPSNAEVRRG